MMTSEMEPTLDDPRNSGRAYGRGTVGDYLGTDVTKAPGLPVPRTSDSGSWLAAVAGPGDRAGTFDIGPFIDPSVTDAPTDSGAVAPESRPESGTGGTPTVGSRTGAAPAVQSRTGGHRTGPPPARRAWPPRGRAPKGRLQLIAVLGLLLGGAAMLTSAALTQTTGTEVPVLSKLATAPVPPSERPIPEHPPPPATPGTCLTWRRDDAADAAIVDCAGPHLFEQTGAVSLTQYGPDAPLPDNESFRELVNEQCTKLVTDYLHGRYDPNGAFRAGALKPAAKAWFSGNRSMRCGLQRFSRSGALYPISGKVADQDQSDVHPAGSCLGIDGKFVGDPVSCAQPHAVQSVGSIDLGQKFTKYPQFSDQDNYLQPQCTKLASGYAGGVTALDNKNLSVIWGNLSQDSWNAGTRKVTCNLAAQLPDHSGFAPITGDAKGKVSVGDLPAPPAQRTSEPGAPADGGSAGPAPAPDQQANGGGDVNQLPKPALPSPPSSLNRPPRLPQLPNPFANKDGQSPPNPLGDNNNGQPANPLGGNNGKPLLPGASDNKDGGL